MIQKSWHYYFVETSEKLFIGKMSDILLNFSEVSCFNLKE
jgi:hypothetical protein